MTDPSSTSRERFLASLARCVKYQREDIQLPDPPRARDETYAFGGDFLPEEPSGNGATTVPTDTETIWGLRPPGEEMPPPPEVAFC
jgi:hypothetical protein